MAITTTIMTIGAKQAQAILDGNTNNFRRIDTRKIQQYAREMKNGLWQFNGEPIQIYEDGTLANGQHRLNAIIRADVEIPVVIIKGIPKTVTTFDVGSKRSIQQIAAARGMKMSTQKAGAISMIMFGICDKSSRYGADELLNFYESIPAIDEIERIIQHGADKPVLRRSACVAAAFAAVMLGKITTDYLDKFSRIANGGLPIDGMVSNAPLCLRKTFQDGFKDSTGMPITWGSVSLPLYFDVTYRAICDFAKQRSPMRSYKPKMTNQEMNTIISEVRNKIAQIGIVNLVEG